MKYKSNNIVIIIGNGFDLAHDLKTSYNDFSNWFILKIEKEILTLQIDNSILNRTFSDFIRKNNIRPDRPGQILNAIHHFLGIVFFSNETINKTLQNNKSIIYKLINNRFLGRLYANKYKNWFDIENAYFQELITIKNNYQDNPDKASVLNKLRRLNRELVEIKEYLKEYLDTLNITKNTKINNFSDKLFLNKNIDFYINIINFNYTDTIEYYFSNFTDGITNIKNVNINYIHGNLKNDNIIFGYGNDQHKEYQEIKNLEIDTFLENFKTFRYLDNNNYSKIYDDLLDNNNVDDYIVFVLGHSLGSTDKTLLEEIFNNEKCKQIHLFKRKDLKDNDEKLKKSFDDLVFSASRILTHEKGLRKKILNYEDSMYFP